METKVRIDYDQGRTGAVRLRDYSETAYNTNDSIDFRIPVPNYASQSATIEHRDEEKRRAARGSGEEMSRINYKYIRKVK